MGNKVCSEETCKNTSRNVYCKTHICIHYDCVSFVEENKIMCDFHATKCKKKSCNNKRIVDRDYCTRHECFYTSCRNKSNIKDRCNGELCYYGCKHVYCKDHSCRIVGCINSCDCWLHMCSQPGCNSVKNTLDRHCTRHKYMYRTTKHYIY